MSAIADQRGAPSPEVVSPWRTFARVSSGVGALVAGVGLIIFSTVTLTSAGAVLRVIIILAGSAFLYYGVDKFGKLVAGPGFETGAWMSGAWLLAVLVAAALADLLPLAEYRDVSKTLTEPSLLRPDLLSAHPLGTNREGLDILGGVIHGARVSMIVGIGAGLIGMTIGGVIGISAGYFRGRIETFTNFVTDSMLAFPPLILLLGMVAVLEPSVRNVTLALALLSIPTYIRLTKANTLVFAQREFVLAAQALGARHRRIIFRELLPSVLLPVVSYASIMVSVLLVAEASLSFLGLSVQRPNPTWGNMIAAGQDDFNRHPHLVFVPGVVLFGTVYAMNRLGDLARRRWDPQASQL